MAGVTTLAACSSENQEHNPIIQQEIVTTIESPVTIEFWHAMAGDKPSSC